MIINNRPPIIPGISTNQNQINQQKNSTNASKTNFSDLLKENIQKQADVKMSKHAEARLNSRNINLNSAQMERIKNGVNKAQEKGVKDSLVLVDDVALVVNVRNRTVVTAASTQELKENVFTNIDGAVIV